MDIDVIVAASSATDAFKADARALARHLPTPRIVPVRRAPVIKLQRLVAQLLTAERELEIEAIRVEAHAGCSDFVGMVDVETTSGPRRFQFAWCCRWRAEQEGWTDCFGFPDQIRAAHEFGWRCFRVWREVVVPASETTSALETAGER